MNAIAGISVDVDSVACHLRGYGFFDSSDRDSVYGPAMMRMLELFERHDVKATFFLVAEELRERPELLQELVSRGHEIGSHSLTHSIAVDPDGAAIRKEVVESKTILEQLSQTRVVGYRSPGWERPRGLTDALREAGYVYDASGYPALMLALLRWQVRRRGGQRPARRIGPTEDCRSFVAQLPMCHLPVVGLPYYHTLKLLLPRSAFAGLRWSILQFARPIHYVFHAVDFLACREDGLDPRLCRHPGMEMSLAQKLQSAEEEIQLLARRFALRPLCDLSQRQNC